MLVFFCLLDVIIWYVSSVCVVSCVHSRYRKFRRITKEHVETLANSKATLWREIKEDFGLWRRVRREVPVVET